VNLNLEALALSGETAVAPLGRRRYSPKRGARIGGAGDRRALPAVNVYCEKIANQLVEKFRTFSGISQMAIEVRHSQDRLEGLQDTVELYASAVMQTLDATGETGVAGCTMRAGIRLRSEPSRAGESTSCRRPR